MKRSTVMNPRQRETGAALITALLVSIATALLLAASLAVAMSSNKLGWKQVDAQSALQLADAGVNSELQYIALNVSASTLLKSSQPSVYSGVTAILQATGQIVKGRPGTVTGYTGGNYYVYSSNNATGTTAWDGITSPYYITSSACVNGVWETVQIQASSSSVFNVGGLISTGGDPCSPTSITVAPSANVTMTGSAACNGKISKGTGCTFKSPCAINANSDQFSDSRFDSTCVNTGGQLCSVSPPVCYPKTSDVCRKVFGCNDTDSDATAYSKCQQNSCNNTGVYQYNNAWWSSDSSINTSNCCQYTGIGNTLTCDDFNNANIKPGTWSNWWDNNSNTCAVQTLIFEPGDYYFTKAQIAYQANCEMVVDPCAYASGGTPGQVRFWVCDANSNTNGNTTDYCQIPIKNTCPSGQSPDPGQFRIYYGKDGGTCTFTRPDSCKDYQGNTVTGDFNYCCGIYACTKPATVTSSQNGCTTTTTVGATVSFCGHSTDSTKCCNINGSMLCDKCQYSGNCKPTYVQSQTCTKDPVCGGQVLKWTCNGH